MNASNLQTEKSERVYSVVQIVVFSVIVAVMVVFLLLLCYQWFTRPASYTPVVGIPSVIPMMGALV